MTKFFRRGRKEYVIFQLAAALVGLASYMWYKTAPAVVSQPKETTTCVVSRVVDGDTLKLSNGEKVRLIGVDTPEVHESDKLIRDAARIGRDSSVVKKLGEKSARFTKDMVDGKKVDLKFDVKKRDRYGRLLAYVYLEDGTFVNAEIIAQGYGQIMTVPPNTSHAKEFLKLQEDARKNNRGLWVDDSYRALYKPSKEARRL